MLSREQLTKLLSQAIPIAQQAGDLTLTHYKKPGLRIEVKSDHSRVTNADLEANDLLVEKLAEIAIFPILSEELPYYVVPDNKPYWLLDPIDGTEEFIKQTGNFAINVALIHNFRPVLGIIHLPAHNKTYYAAKGLGSFCDTLDGTTSTTQRLEKTTSSHYKENCVCIASKRDPISQQLLDDFFPSPTKKFISSAYKFCLLAHQEADFYLRTGVTKEWDTAPGEIILEEMGGGIFSNHDEKILYNQEDPTQPPFLACVYEKDTQHLQKLFQAMHRLKPGM